MAPQPLPARKALIVAPTAEIWRELTAPARRKVPGVVAVKCNWCTKFRPKWRIHKLQSNQVICDHCLDWHYHALEFLGGAPPRGCQVCHKTWAHLQDETPDVKIRMYVVPKDSILQLLCRACVLPFLPKQSHLYKGTQFGRDSLKVT
jgi:hypothetical protein